MKKNIEEIMNKVLDSLPSVDVTKFPGMTYEQGIEEVLTYLLGETLSNEFPYAVKEKT